MKYRSWHFYSQNLRFLKTAEVEGLASVTSVWACLLVDRESDDHRSVLKHSKLKELSPGGEAFMQHTFSNLIQKDSTLTRKQITENQIKIVSDWFWIVHQQNISEKCFWLHLHSGRSCIRFNYYILTFEYALPDLHGRRDFTGHSIHMK